MLLSSVVSGYTQNYSREQENLRTEISDYLRKQGLHPEKESDGLRFKSEGDTYYIEIDKEAKDPMYICLRRYVKYNEKLSKNKISKNLNDYNSYYGIKVYCIKESFVLSSEMFVSEATEFNDVFERLLYQMRSAYNKINK